MMMEIERSAAARTVSIRMGMDHIERKSSIETEPRTLNIHQVHFAREAALFVLNNTSFEQASTIFTQGLEPVSSVAKQDDDDMYGQGDDEDEQHYAKQRHVQHVEFRDVTSAPF